MVSGLRLTLAVAILCVLAGCAQSRDSQSFSSEVQITSDTHTGSDIEVLSPGTPVDLSGTWISTITSNHPWYLQERHQALILQLAQTGDQIRATGRAQEVELIGELDGNVIRFSALPGLATGFNALEGQWAIQENSNLLLGEWKAVGHEAGGIWNLRRFENRGVEMYLIETGPALPFHLNDSDRLFERIFHDSDNRNVVFYIHGRGGDFEKNFELLDLPYIESQSNTRFVILRWLSWGENNIRPQEHASQAALGLSDFLVKFNEYSSRYPQKLDDTRISLMAHSMGNIPLMVFLDEYYSSQSLQQGLLDSVILSSADVPLRNHSGWVENIDFSSQVYILQHRRDYVLHLSNWLFEVEPELPGPKLGVGPVEGSSRVWDLAENAFYLDITDLALPFSHRHFSMSNYADGSRINRLYSLLLNGRKIEYPDSRIGLFDEPANNRRYIFRNLEAGKFSQAPGSGPNQDR